MEVSMSAFVEAALASGPSKMSKVSEAFRQSQQKYDPRHNYWGPLRNQIIRLHETNSPAEHLDQVLGKVDSQKHDNYRLHIDGYKRFLKRRVFEWIASPQGGRWNHGELSVRVNPDLRTSISGSDHLLRLHFKKDADPRLSRNRAKAMAALIGEAFEKSSTIGIVDVRLGKLMAPSVDSRVLPWLRSEAASFAELWHEIEFLRTVSGS